MNSETDDYVVQAANEFAAQIQAYFDKRVTLEYTPDHTYFLLRLEPFDAPSEDREGGPIGTVGSSEAPEGKVAIRPSTYLHVPTTLPGPERN